MSKYIDIEELTQEALQLVEVEQSEKTASEGLPPYMHSTEIGQAIKAAAERIREYDDTSVTAEDLQRLVSAVREKTAMGAGQMIGGALGAGLGVPMGPAGMIGGGMLGASLGKKLQGTPQPDVQAPAPGALPTGAPKMASELGNELRKLAETIREQGDKNEEIRLTKAAHMLTAAVGLEHLIRGLK